MKEGVQESAKRADKGRKRKRKFTVTNSLCRARYLTVNELARTRCGKERWPTARSRQSDRCVRLVKTGVSCCFAPQG